jgi:DNA-binding MarR family transcriptional regulator
MRPIAMPVPRPEDIVYELTDLHARLIRGLDGTLSVHGISYTEYNVLRQVGRSPQQQMRRIDLAERIGMTASGVTRLLRPMEKIGLVEKLASERDARVSLVVSSPAGKRLLAEAEIAVGHFSEDRLRPLLPAQRGTLADLIGLLR